jgi:hypothetical protein
MWWQGWINNISRFPPVHPTEEFPLYVLELPMCHQRMCMKLDNPRGLLLNPTISHHTCVHTMLTHTMQESGRKQKKGGGYADGSPRHRPDAITGLSRPGWGGPRAQDYSYNSCRHSHAYAEGVFRGLACRPIRRRPRQLALGLGPSHRHLGQGWRHPFLPAFSYISS